MSLDPFRVPDGITPIEAFRAWTYAFDGALGRLQPLSGGFDDGPSAWAEAGSGWLRATCGVEALTSVLSELTALPDPWHEAPNASCSCGFYAVKHLAALQEIVARIHVPTVIGRVQLAGTVIEHELGYRAERARIVELIPWYGQETTARRLAMCLGVAVGRPVVPLFHVPPHDRDPSSPRRPLRSWMRPPVSDHRARLAARSAA